MDRLQLSEVEQFLQATQEICPDYYPLFLTAVRAGLRRGELVALQWGDIQFGADEDDPNRYIYVQRNYVQGAFTTPKSKKRGGWTSRASCERLYWSCGTSGCWRTFLEGEASMADELVFPSKAGDTVLDPDNLVHYYFMPALEKAGLRRIRFHDLRHTFGSLLIQDGASLTYVKEQMGHNSIQVTVDVYGHLIPGANVAWVDGLDRKNRPVGDPSGVRLVSRQRLRYLAPNLANPDQQHRFSNEADAIEKVIRSMEEVIRSMRDQISSRV